MYFYLLAVIYIKTCRRIDLNVGVTNCGQNSCNSAQTIRIHSISYGVWESKVPREFHRDLFTMPPHRNVANWHDIFLGYNSIVILIHVKFHARHERRFVV